MKYCKWFFVFSALYFVWEITQTVKILGLHKMIIFEVIFVVTFLFLAFIAKREET